MRMGMLTRNAFCLPKSLLAREIIKGNPKPSFVFGSCSAKLIPNENQVTTSAWPSLIVYMFSSHRKNPNEISVKVITSVIPQRNLYWNDEWSLLCLLTSGIIRQNLSEPLIIDNYHGVKVQRAGPSELP